VHHRPLALVFVLAGADYLLWNWSLQGNHDVLALVSGLTLTPLALALMWLLALNVARLLGWVAQRPRVARGNIVRRGTVRGHTARGNAPEASQAYVASAYTATGDPEPAAGDSEPSEASSEHSQQAPAGEGAKAKQASRSSKLAA
jgi:hypothetical protein